MGAAVAFVGAVGDDELGAEAVAELEARASTSSGVARVDAPTGVALIVVDAAGENQIAVASGANAELDAAARHRRPSSALPRPRGLAGRRHGPAAHPSSRRRLAAPPRLAAAPTAGRRPARPRGLAEVVSAAASAAARPAGRSCSTRRPRASCPTRRSPSSRRTRPRPPSSRAATTPTTPPPSSSRDTGAAVLITLGGDGALLLEPGGEPVRLPATRVDVVDTTGAGDTVNGALAAELAAGRPLADAARFALTAAALSTTAAGRPRRHADARAVERARETLPHALAGAARCVAGAGLAAYAGWVEPRRLVVRELELALPHWPASLAGLRAGVMSDLHAGRAARGARRDPARGRRAQRARAGRAPAARRLPRREPAVAPAARARAGGGGARAAALAAAGRSR